MQHLGDTGDGGGLFRGFVGVVAGNQHVDFATDLRGVVTVFRVAPRMLALSCSAMTSAGIIAAPNRRATTSLGPHAAKGTTSVIGFVG